MGSRKRSVDSPDFCVRNESKDTVIAAQVQYASSFWKRLKGFLGKETISPQQGIWLPQCKQVHSLGMKCDLDYFVLDETLKVVDMGTLKPNQISKRYPHSFSILEVSSGVAQLTYTELRDQFQIETCG